MDDRWKEIRWQPFDGSIEIFENAVRVSPKSLWGDQVSRQTADSTQRRAR